MIVNSVNSFFPELFENSFIRLIIPGTFTGLTPFRMRAIHGFVVCGSNHNSILIRESGIGRIIAIEACPHIAGQR